MKTIKQMSIEKLILCFNRIKQQNPNPNLDFDSYSYSLIQSLPPLPSNFQLMDIQFSYTDSICCWNFYIKTDDPNSIDQWLYDDSNTVHIIQIHKNLYQASIFAY